MARQTGVPFVGRAGNLSFYHDKVHGYLVRTAGGPTREQIKKKKNFAAVRKNNSVFGLASTYNRVLRGGFDPILGLVGDYYTSRRLQALLYQVLKRAQTDGSPLEEVLAAEFRHFELLDGQPFAGRFDALPKCRVDGGSVSIHGALKLRKKGLEGATHLQCTGCAVVVRPDWKQVWRDVQQGPLIKLGKHVKLNLEHALPGKGLLFYGVAVQWYREERGSIHLVADGPHCGFLGYGEKVG